MIISTVLLVTMTTSTTFSPTPPTKPLYVFAMAELLHMEGQGPRPWHCHATLCTPSSFHILAKLLLQELRYDTHNIQQPPQLHVLPNQPRTLLQLQLDQVFQYASFAFPPAPPAPDPFFYSKAPSYLDFFAFFCQLGSSQFWPPPAPDPVPRFECMSGNIVASCPPSCP
eukprot:14334092-Ditylum_brightwellii.AAC.1